MRTKRTLQELTIKDSFMFAAVMQEEENCRRLLELVLRIKIARVEVSLEKSMMYNPEYHGVRLDVFAKDEEKSHFNVEMQVRKKSVERRSRYYHSQMDMEYLQSGKDYKELPNSFVIFICDYDPFGKKKYQYTVRKYFQEIPDLTYQDGIHSIFLSTMGNNEDEVPGELVKFLRYVHSDLSESTQDFEDDFVKRLQETVARVKKSREVGARYMLFEEMMREEKLEGIKQGKVESIMLLLSSRFSVAAGLQEKLSEINSNEKLEELFVAALHAESLQDFENHLIEK